MPHKSRHAINDHISHSASTFSQAALRLAQALDAEFQDDKGFETLEEPEAVSRPRRGRNERGSTRNSFDVPNEHLDLNKVSQHPILSAVPAGHGITHGSFILPALSLFSLVHLWDIAAACYFVQVMWGVPDPYWRILAVIFLLLRIPIMAAFTVPALHSAPAFSQTGALGLRRLPWMLQLPLLLVITSLLDLASLTLLHVMQILMGVGQRPPAAPPAPRPAAHHPKIPSELVGFRMAHMEHTHLNQPQHRVQAELPRTGCAALGLRMRTPHWLQRQLLLVQHRAVMLLLRMLLQSLPMAGLQIAALACAPGISGPGSRTADRAGVAQALAASLLSITVAALELSWTWQKGRKEEAESSGRGGSSGSGKQPGCCGPLGSWVHGLSQQVQRIVSYQGGVTLPSKWRDKCEGKAGVFDLGALGPHGDLQPLQAILAAATLAARNHAGQLSITNTPPPTKRGPGASASGLVLLAAQPAAFDALPIVLHALGLAAAEAGVKESAGPSTHHSKACEAASVSGRANSSSKQKRGGSLAAAAPPAPTVNKPRVRVMFGVAAASVEPPAPWHVAKSVAVLEPAWLVEMGLGDVALTPDTVQALCASLRTGHCALEKLVLKDCGLSGPSVHSICSAAIHAPYLTELTLSSNKLSMGHDYAGSTITVDEGGDMDEEDIAAKARGCTAALALRSLLEGSSSLAKLALAYTGMTSIDAGELLAGALASPSLTHLDLSQNEVDDVLPIGMVQPPPPPMPRPSLHVQPQQQRARSNSLVRSLTPTAPLASGGSGSTIASPRSTQALPRRVSKEYPRGVPHPRQSGSGYDAWRVASGGLPGRWAAPEGRGQSATDTTSQRSPPLATLDLSFNWISDNLAGWLLLTVTHFPQLSHLLLNHNNAPAGTLEDQSPEAGPSRAPSASGRGQAALGHRPNPNQHGPPTLPASALKGLEMVYHLRAHGLQDCGDLRMLNLQVLDLRGVQLPADFLAPAPLTLTIRSDVIPGGRRDSSMSMSVTELLDLPPSTKASATMATIESKQSAALAAADSEYMDSPRPATGASGQQGGGQATVGTPPVRYTQAVGDRQASSTAAGAPPAETRQQSGASTVAHRALNGAHRAGDGSFWGGPSSGAAAPLLSLPVHTQPVNPWEGALPEAVREGLSAPGAVLDMGSGMWRGMTRAQRVASLYTFFASQRRVLLTNTAPGMRTTITSAVVVPTGSGLSTPRGISRASSFAVQAQPASLPSGLMQSGVLQHALTQAQALLRRDSNRVSAQPGTTGHTTSSLGLSPLALAQSLASQGLAPTSSNVLSPGPAAMSHQGTGTPHPSEQLSRLEAASGFVSFAAQPMRNVWPSAAGVASSSGVDPLELGIRAHSIAPTGSQAGRRHFARSDTATSAPILKLTVSTTHATTEGEREGEQEGSEEGDGVSGPGALLMCTTPDDAAYPASRVRAAAVRQRAQLGPRRTPMAASGTRGVVSSLGSSGASRPSAAEVAMGPAALEPLGTPQRKPWILEAAPAPHASPASGDQQRRVSLDQGHARVEQRRAAAAGAPCGVLVVGSFEGGPVLRVPLHALLLPLWAALSGRTGLFTPALPTAPLATQLQAAAGGQQPSNPTQARARAMPPASSALLQLALQSIPSMPSNAGSRSMGEIHSTAGASGHSGMAAHSGSGHPGPGQQQQVSSSASPRGATHCLALDLHLMGVPEEQHAALGALLQLLHPVQLSATEALAAQQQTKSGAAPWRSSMVSMSGTGPRHGMHDGEDSVRHVGGTPCSVRHNQATRNDEGAGCFGGCV